MFPPSFTKNRSNSGLRPRPIRHPQVRLRRFEEELSLRSSSGFSLVEVTLAVGLLSFALVAMLGMVPVGLKTFDESVNTTVEAQIAQKMFTSVQQTSFADIRGSANPSGGYYFDAEGFPASASSFVYTARVTVPADDTEGTRVPASGAAAVNPKLRTLTIEIAKNRPVDVARAQDPSALKVFTFMTADVGL